MAVSWSGAAAAAVFPFALLPWPFPLLPSPAAKMDPAGSPGTCEPACCLSTFRPSALSILSPHGVDAFRGFFFLPRPKNLPQFKNRTCIVAAAGDSRPPPPRAKGCREGVSEHPARAWRSTCAEGEPTGRQCCRSCPVVC